MITLSGVEDYSKLEKKINTLKKSNSLLQKRVKELEVKLDALLEVNIDDDETILSAEERFNEWLYGENNGR